MTVHVVGHPVLLDAAVVGGLVVLVGIVARFEGPVAAAATPAATDGGAAWYDDGVALAREVQTVARDHDPPADFDRVQRDLLPLASRLKGHARTAARPVEGEHAMALHELGVACTDIAVGHSPVDASRTGVFLEDKLDALEEQAAAAEDVLAATAPTTESTR